jgi:hypothetical protein
VHAAAAAALLLLLLLLLLCCPFQARVWSSWQHQHHWILTTVLQIPI